MFSNFEIFILLTRVSSFTPSKVGTGLASFIHIRQNYHAIYTNFISTPKTAYKKART